jgi:hypothetical protein
MWRWEVVGDGAGQIMQKRRGKGRRMARRGKGRRMVRRGKGNS